MSDFKFNCPHCQQSLEAPEDMLGQEIDCPSCNGRIELPSSRLREPTPNSPPQGPDVNGADVSADGLTYVHVSSLGEAFCWKCRKMDSTSKLLYNKENDIYAHEECIKNAVPQRDAPSKTKPIHFFFAFVLSCVTLAAIMPYAEEYSESGMGSHRSWRNYAVRILVAFVPFTPRTQTEVYQTEFGIRTEQFHVRIAWELAVPELLVCFFGYSLFIRRTLSPRSRTSDNQGRTTPPTLRRVPRRK